MSSALFEQAVAHVAKPGGPPQTNDTKLFLYAHFKQATEGDNGREAPSFLNFVARSKHDAWAGIKGTPKEAAKQKYIAKLIEVDPRFKVPAEAAASPTPAKPDSSLTVVKPPPSRPASQPNPVLNAAFAAFIALIPLGAAVFLLHTYSPSALFGLSLVGLGLAGVAGTLLKRFDESGLISLLPASVANMLLDWTLMEFLLSDTVLKSVKEFAVQVGPIFLADGDEETQLRALSHMAPRTRRILTQRGIVRLLPPRVQTLLLPRPLRERLAREAPRYRLASKTESDPAKLVALLKPRAEEGPGGGGNSNGGGGGLDMESSRELFRELISNVISRRNVEYVLYFVDPNWVRSGAAVLSLAALAQLAVSTRARETLKSMLATLMLVGTLGGAGGCAGLFVLWLAAKKRKKQMVGRFLSAH
jgi:diazepam-binding inhibitor (GABA receptor modulating acyl-CoA-binding protein)